jgi:hypothetical protein
MIAIAKDMVVGYGVQVFFPFPPYQCSKSTGVVLSRRRTRTSASDPAIPLKYKAPIRCRSSCFVPNRNLASVVNKYAIPAK